MTFLPEATMTDLHAVCVFTGSSIGRRDEYKAAAVALGRDLAARGLTLVYGGGNVGLMGIIADAVLASGGDVIGVIPESLKRREVAHETLTTLHVVDTMHERKAKMAELSDGFIAMPGGLGTLEELFEVLTWAQLGIHDKPCGLLNVDGYYDGLIAFVDKQVEERFVMQAHRDMIYVEADPASLLGRFSAHRSTVVAKSFDRV
jgi:uncharacterized protein (TIGR00730 family)